MIELKEIILVNVSGEDKPGVTSTLTAILSLYHVNILDIGQAVIHNTLSLGFLIEVPPRSESSHVLKDLLFKAHELSLSLRFTPINETEYETWVELQGKDRHVLTVLGPRLTAEQIARVTGVIAAQQLNIDKITRLSGRRSLTHQVNAPTRACVEFSVRGRLENAEQLRAQLMTITEDLGVDIAFQADNIYRRNRRLVAFDMDSTLIRIEVIDELAKRAGVGQEVSGLQKRQ
ncbi:MAG: ACT domain-containing protein [Pyrinomonadaceae bacterium]